ncbi:hypothetical protein [Psychromicrobium sp. YIM B11713]|uniref:hypothetical protein n=1 Tax=Psychromicrobium sp. YIM B11713 TaxID=3145233 RepID=UPI00374EBBFA
MNNSLAMPEVMETQPGKIMPEALIELDFQLSGPAVTPATMGDGDTTITLSSSCTAWQKPLKP